MRVRKLTELAVCTVFAGCTMTDLIPTQLTVGGGRYWGEQEFSDWWRNEANAFPDVDHNGYQVSGYLTWDVLGSWRRSQEREEQEKVFTRSMRSALNAHAGALGALHQTTLHEGRRLAEEVVTDFFEKSGEIWRTDPAYVVEDQQTVLKLGPPSSVALTTAEGETILLAPVADAAASAEATGTGEVNITISQEQKVEEESSPDADAGEQAAEDDATPVDVRVLGLSAALWEQLVIALVGLVVAVSGWLGRHKVAAGYRRLRKNGTSQAKDSEAPPDG